MADSEEDQKHNLIRTTVRPKVLARPPLQRAIVVLACPLSQIGTCPRSESKWLCDTCRIAIEYSLESDEIYCECGSFPVDACTFCCCSENHGEEFVSDQNLQEKLVALKPVESINILILGETGVGKSTWINSIANYMTYSTFQEAMSARELLHLIPTYFDIMDENDEKHTIKIGEEDKTKEVYSIEGQSATQMTSSYVFRYDDLNLRLLDTPGVGDCRGLSKDRENFSHVMAYLANFECLHGICILLKPDENRLTTNFKFCISEMLRHLHRSATDNIVFCFTNGRKTDFKVYQTEKPLAQAIQDCTKERGITIKMDKSTMFVLENESFQYLAAHYQGVKFSKSKIKKCDKSWMFSKNEFGRLVNYLKKKNPHQLKSTISLNEARSVLNRMIKPMTEISSNINTNKALFEKEKKKIIESGGKDDGEKILAKQVRLVTEDFYNPASVCTDSNCMEYITDPETGAISATYKDICAQKKKIWDIVDTALSLVPLYSFANLLINKHGISNKCLKCQHDKSRHVTITYMTYPQVYYQEVAGLAELNKAIADLTQTSALVNEIKEKFCQFLKIHSAVASDDACADQIDKEIETAKLTPANSQEEKSRKKERLSNLECFKEEHELKRNSSSEQASDSNCISPEQVFELREQLYAIPCVSKYLKDRDRVTATANANVLKDEETIWYIPSRIPK